MLTSQHRVHIFCLNITAFHQLFTGKTDSFFFGIRLQVQEDVAFADTEQVFVFAVCHDAVTQRCGHFLFVLAGFVHFHQT
ncbi:hypothetical protein D3C80_1818110 [compost metagenome]